MLMLLLSSRFSKGVAAVGCDQAAKTPRITYVPKHSRHHFPPQDTLSQSVSEARGREAPPAYTTIVAPEPKHPGAQVRLMLHNFKS